MFSSRLVVLSLAVAVVLTVLVPLAAAGPEDDGEGIETSESVSDSHGGMTGHGGTISPTLDDATGTVRIVVRFEDGAVPGVETAGRSERAVERLQSRAERSQAELRTLAGQTDGVRVERQFWLANAVLVTVDTDRVSLERLAALEGVRAVHENVRVASPTVASDTTSAPIRNHSGAAASGDGFDSASATVDAGTTTATTYGPRQIGVGTARETYRTRGEDVRVAILDTGIDTNHSDLSLPDAEADWAYFDDEGEPVDVGPFDDHGHGTMVSGIVAGETHEGRQYGVAPDVHLMHAKVLDPKGTFAQIVAGMEWAIERDADVISMSLGTPEFHDAFVEPVRTARRSGAVVVAAAGNRGRNTSNAPANVYDAFAVGATDETGTIWSDSSGKRIDTDSALEQPDRPADWPDKYVVPDVVAPGDDIRSSYPTENGRDRYAQLDGTSMAAPHVTGGIALVMAAVEDATPAESQRALTATASKPAARPSDGDIRYGDGIVDVPAAIASLNGTIDGTVRSARTGTPIVGATVTVLDGNASVRTARTGTNGTYDVTLPRGTYDLRIDAGGYDATTRSNVTVETNSITTANATLVGNVTVTGRVIDAHSGTLIPNATVVVTGNVPINGTSTPPADTPTVTHNDSDESNDTRTGSDSDGDSDTRTGSDSDGESVTKTGSDSDDGINTATERTTTVRHEVTTGPDGRYAVRGLNAAGTTYELAANASGYDGRVLGKFDTGNSDLVVRTVPLSGAATITGAVRANGTDVLPENVTVVARGDTGRYVGTVRNGTFTISGVPTTGRAYRVNATARAFEANSTLVIPNDSVSDLHVTLSRLQRYLGVTDVTSPTTAEAGDTYEVTAAVTNLGSGPVDDVVSYVFDNETVGSASVVLNATETTTVSFEHRVETAGTYEHGIGTANETETRRLAVDPDDEPAVTARPVFYPIDDDDDSSEPRLSVETTIAPTNVTTGTPVSITARVHNGGDTAGEECVRITANGTTVGAATVTVPAGETAETEHRYRPETAEPIDITVTNATTESNTACDRHEVATRTIEVDEDGDGGGSGRDTNATVANETTAESTGADGPTESERTIPFEPGLPIGTLTKPVRNIGAGVGAMLVTLLVGLGVRSRS